MITQCISSIQTNVLIQCLYNLMFYNNNLCISFQILSLIFTLYKNERFSQEETKGYLTLKSHFLPETLENPAH